MPFVRWRNWREKLHSLLEDYCYEPFNRTKATDTYRQKSVKSIGVDTQCLFID